MASRLVTTGEAARSLGVEPRTIQRWAAAGQITAASKTIGGHLRWDLDDLRQQIERITEN